MVIISHDFIMHDLSAISVLVVDDNPNMRRVLRALLGTLNVKFIFEAGSAPDALKTLNDVPVDIVITDLNMKPVSGIEFTRMVRRGRNTLKHDIPIIMVTAHTDIHLVERARDVGIDEFVAKPVSAQALYERIAEISTNLRPLVRSPDYTGPDRRRRKRPHSGPERRSQPPTFEPRKKS